MINTIYFAGKGTCFPGGARHMVRMPTEPEWRNWQTRQVEGLVRVNLVQVQVLSPALQSGQEVTAIRGLLPFAFSQPLGKILVKSLA